MRRNIISTAETIVVVVVPVRCSRRLAVGAVGPFGHALAEDTSAPYAWPQLPQCSPVNR